MFTIAISLGGSGERPMIMTEAVTVLEGLRLAVDMAIQKVAVESSSQVLIMYL